MVQILQRKKEAAAREILSEVLPEIRQLERGADRIRSSDRLRILHVVEREHETPHRIGGAAAIGEQIVPGRKRRVARIHTEGVQEVEEGLDRESMPLDRVRQRGE